MSKISDKDYKKLEVYLINKIFSDLKYAKSNYEIHKVKHSNIPIKIYPKMYREDTLKYIFEMLTSQLVKNNIPVKIEIANLRLIRKLPKSIVRPRYLHAHVDFMLDRNIDIETHLGLLKLKKLI